MFIERTKNGIHDYSINGIPHFLLDILAPLIRALRLDCRGTFGGGCW